MYYERLTASFVLRYINRYLSTPVDQIPKELLEEYSYRRCSAYEIMDRIKRNPEKDGQLIVENYIREMFLYKTKMYLAIKRIGSMADDLKLLKN